MAVSIGNRIAPPRFLAFCVVAVVAVPVAIARYGWSTGIMLGFDAAAALFLLSCARLLGDASAQRMRVASRRNDANRLLVLVVAAAASIAVLAAVAGELGSRHAPSTGAIALIIATLVLAWLFGNVVYALHYAHVFYLPGRAGRDAGGLEFPKTPEPGYWDFLYFAMTLGMTFQTSDVAMTSTSVRRIATAHSLIAFIFNLGVVAFTVNVLGGG